jgi:hypothetical protein
MGVQGQAGEVGGELARVEHPSCQPSFTHDPAGEQSWEQGISPRNTHIMPDS